MIAYNINPQKRKEGEISIALNLNTYFIFFIIKTWYLIIYDIIFAHSRLTINDRRDDTWEL